MPPSRYVGRFVVEDVRNSKKYLFDLRYRWDRGHDLADWVLDGTTNPTIDAVGNIDMFDNINLANQSSSMAHPLPNTLGDQPVCFCAKVTRQADESSTDGLAFNIAIDHIAGPFTIRGHGYAYDKSGPPSEHHWMNQFGQGYEGIVAFNPAVNVEHDICLIIAKPNILLIVDGVLVDSGPYGFRYGGHEIVYQDWNSGNKNLKLYARHNAGEVSHWKVRDIRAGMLVGVSS
jgi:hypothetical protein